MNQNGSSSRKSSIYYERVNNKLMKSMKALAGRKIFRHYFLAFKTAEEVSRDCGYKLRDEKNVNYPTVGSSVVRYRDLWLEHDYLDERKVADTVVRYPRGKRREYRWKVRKHRANLRFYWDLAEERGWELTGMDKKLIKRCFDDAGWRKKAVGHEGVSLNDGVTRVLQEMVATNLFQHGTHGMLGPHERKVHDRMFGVAFPGGPRLALENGDIARFERFIDEAVRSTAGMEESHRSILYVMSLPPGLCKKLLKYTMPKLLGDKLLMKYREDLPVDSLLRRYL